MQECKVFEEVLRVQCPSSRLRISLTGAGIAPAVKVSSQSSSCQLRGMSPAYLQDPWLSSQFIFSFVACGML